MSVFPKNATFNTYKAQYLNNDDIFRLVEKLCNSKEMSDALIKKLKEHRGRVLELLETPLLVTLLVSEYRQSQQLPEQLSDFYDRIFATLFDRHDSFKVPHQRHRRLKISTNAYKKAFEKFCYASLFVEVLSDEVAEKIAVWALKGSAEGASVGADYLKDVSEISSLLEEEDSVWSFIHSSVKEYHAAAYLMNGSDDCRHPINQCQAKLEVAGSF